tara:strand:+ start:164708 stop:165124 length:417 start_codon:yes stop_codon:yes gene_type:complete
MKDVQKIKSPPPFLGMHLLLELYDCDLELLNNPKKIEGFLKEAAIASGASIVSVHSNLFNPHGVSAVVIIAESHITLHSWPEYAYAAVDAFTCGESIDTLKIEEILKLRLKANRTSRQIFKRGFVEIVNNKKPEDLVI